MNTKSGTNRTSDERCARAYLMQVAEPSATTVAELVDQHGAIAAAERVASRQVPPAITVETKARHVLDRSAGDLAAAAVAGARLVIPGDDEWPTRPFNAAAARGMTSPLGLWVRGSARLDELTERAVAVVGARAATSYGQHVAADFGYELAQQGWTVVSGAALGIDAAGHRGALSANGTTVAVLPCGIDQAHPAAHERLLTQIAERGALVSQYAPGVRPARHRFEARNRIIAALSTGTVVIEAGRRSGARNTVAAATLIGRMVMAVPGPVTSATSAGCHDMIRYGQAMLVTTAADVIETVREVTE